VPKLFSFLASSKSSSLPLYLIARQGSDKRETNFPHIGLILRLVLNFGFKGNAHQYHVVFADAVAIRPEHERSTHLPFFLQPCKYHGNGNFRPRLNDWSPCCWGNRVVVVPIHHHKSLVKYKGESGCIFEAITEKVLESL